jgi:GTPase SAR1 family protein
MSKNPYKYNGPLDPGKNKPVCVPRSEAVNKVINGIIRGDYWAVLGPRQIGKTTFLNQVRHNFSNAYYIYCNFSMDHPNESDFYRWLTEEFFKAIPSKERNPASKKWKDNPGVEFFNFLKKFTPEDDSKMIILLFDNIDRLPFLKTFLHLWRIVFHDRYHKKALNRYAVIITGSLDLIEQTIGNTSPFNIAEKLYLKDFSDEESDRLIEEPLKQLNIKIEKKAKEKLMAQLSGHPQMMQHACCILTDNAIDSNQTITVEDIDKASASLLETNANLEILRQDLKNNDKLKTLVNQIINGQDKKYYLYKQFSLSGAGPIVDRKSYCAIRNKIYEKLVKDMHEKPKEKFPGSLNHPREAKGDRKNSI